MANPPEWFNKLNPAGEVPVLQHDDGRLLNESLIISEYLDAIFPHSSVTSKDAFQKAKHQILIGSVSDILSGFWQVMQKAKGAAANMDNVFENFEKSLLDNFFGGSKEGMIDYMLWPFFERLCVVKEFGNYELDSQKFPKLTIWISKMKELPAVKETVVRPEDLIRYFKSSISGNPEYDF